MEISIAEAARLAGTTSRTLRHYDDIGLLAPSRVGSNGLRFYDQAALTRLQRILLLRELGLGLSAIGDALSNGPDDTDALKVHLRWLRMERERLDRQISAVNKTIEAAQKGTPIMAEEMLEGFDHTQYREEVEQRWGKKAYARSDAWWRGLGEEGRTAFLAESQEIGQAWRDAQQRALPLDAPEVRDLASRHIAWIAAGWGGVQPTAEQIAGLAEMYVADERFAANYGGTQGATYVRDGLIAFIGEAGG